MMNQLLSPNFIVILTILLGFLSLLPPLLIKDNVRWQNLVTLLIAGFFLVNVLLIDLWYLEKGGIEISILAFGKYSLALHLEGIGLVFLTMLSVLWSCALIYTSGYIKANKLNDQARFMFFLNLSLLIGCLLALSANLFTMFIFYELLTLSTAPLVAHNGGEGALAGVKKYLETLIFSSILLFLPAILIIYNKLQHGNFSYNGFIENNFTTYESILLLLMFLFGIAKAAIYPLHKWLPAAMIAPYPVSALLHAVVVVKAGLFCIYKILVCVFGLSYLQLLFASFNWLLVLPAFTILYSSIKALRTDNIKTILAYSTISQLSLALLGAFLFTPKAILAATMHMVAHSFSKICLFYAAGNFYSAKKTVKLDDLIGIGKELPKTSFIFLLASLSLIGMPPFGGFISKFYILMAATQVNQIGVIIVLIISTLLTGFYMSKFIFYIYAAKPQDDNSALSTEENLPFSMVLSLAICASGLVFFIAAQGFISQLLASL